MGLFCRRSNASLASGSTRVPARLLLKRAGRGDTEAFLDLAAAYFNLATEHLYLCNLDAEAALAQTRSILREGWMRLPYMKRLADWERFLARSLLAVPVDDARSTEGRRPRALVDLDACTKFAVIAFDLENWSYQWLAPALGLEDRKLASLLFNGRCRLLSLDPTKMPRKKRCFLEQVSMDLDGQVTPRQRQAILKKLCGSTEAKGFKSQWLDYRCHLIEMRQQIRFSTQEREAFLTQLGTELSIADMLRPPLLLRLRNFFGFSLQLPEPFIRGTRDLGFGGG